MPLWRRMAERFCSMRTRQGTLASYMDRLMACSRETARPRRIGGGIVPARTSWAKPRSPLFRACRRRDDSASDTGQRLVVRGPLHGRPGTPDPGRRSEALPDNPRTRLHASAADRGRRRHRPRAGPALGRPRLAGPPCRYPGRGADPPGAGTLRSRRPRSGPARRRRTGLAGRAAPPRQTHAGAGAHRPRPHGGSRPGPQQRRRRLSGQALRRRRARCPHRRPRPPRRHRPRRTGVLRQPHLAGKRGAGLPRYGGAGAFAPGIRGAGAAHPARPAPGHQARDARRPGGAQPGSGRQRGGNLRLPPAPAPRRVGRGHPHAPRLRLRPRTGAPLMRPQRLRRQLLLRLMPPLLAIVGATGAIGYYLAGHFVERVFDHWLLDDASALARQVRAEQGEVRVDLPSAAEAFISYDATDTTYFIVDVKERTVAGKTEIPTHGTHVASYAAGIAYDARMDGHRVRVAAVRVVLPDASPVTVRVAETVLKRERARGELLWMLVPAAATSSAAAALSIDYAVRRTTRLLENIALRWNASSQASLAPIQADDVPLELAPFAAALNDLLARIRALLAREREFVANAAHQLRTPLTALRLGLARAAKAPDLATARSTLEELDAATERTTRLIQQLLTLGRIDPEARASLEFVGTDLVALARQVGEAHMDMALAKGIDLALDTPPEPLPVPLHPELFAEALSNLLDNALHYTPRGGRVIIGFQQDPPGVRIADSGPGIPEAERERVFERFARGRQASGPGAGLGLAIVREIAALHGAEVSIGTSPLGGAEALIRFPAAAPHP